MRSIHSFVWVKRLVAVSSLLGLNTLGLGPSLLQRYAKNVYQEYQFNFSYLSAEGRLQVNLKDHGITFTASKLCVIKHFTEENRPRNILFMNSKTAGRIFHKCHHMYDQ